MGSNFQGLGSRGAMRNTQLSKNTPGTSDLKRKVNIRFSPDCMLPDPFSKLKTRQSVTCEPTQQMMTIHYLYGSRKLVKDISVA
jgi:hypothetical protein